MEFYLSAKFRSFNSRMQHLDCRITTSRGQLKAQTDAPKSASGAKVIPYKDQDFYKIREELYKADKKFVDPEFQANDQSLFFSTRPKIYPLIWKRPHVR